MRRYPRLLLLALAGCTLTAAVAATRRPNIVLILADDLGYGDLGCYGQTQIPTPHIDRLAREGMRFTQFYAGAPVCAPSRNVLMTGQHTGHTQIRGNAKVDLRPEDITLAQVLKSAGYFTALYGKWGLGSENSAAPPRKKGFDAFFGYLDQTHAHNYYPSFLVRDEQRVPLRNVVPQEGRYGQGVAATRLDYSHDLIADAALTTLARQTSARPFFLYLAFTLPHANNEKSPDGMEVPDLGAFARTAWPGPEKGFAAMVARLDRDVGRVLSQLKAAGLDDNTIVILTSDNGPHREGGHDADFFNSRGSLRGYKRDLYEGGIRVPFVVRWPGHIGAGQSSDFVGYLGDVMATLAELAGASPPAHLDSLSFAPTLLGRAAAQPPHEFLYWEFYEGRSAQAVRFGDWKAVRSPLGTGPIELYDLATDRAEEKDVAAAHPAEVERARAWLDQAHQPSALWPAPR